ncbi:hypothetical protein [Jatrophihabitans sp.]|uniref:hypothetical protein n=1 Tax=Jatrophihabitans sp. TaxID=1932789 RepID=UPI002BF333E9|nr:hypothetical protein [Jatrophihabitans sp.]
MDIDVVDRSAGPVVGTRRVSGRVIATVAVVVVLVVATVVLRNVAVSRANRAPYAADAISASVWMEIVAPGQAQPTVDRLAGPGRLPAPFIEPADGGPAPQQVVGQLTFSTPPNAPTDGQYALFVIERARNKPVDALYGAGPAGTDVMQGWDGRYDKVAAKYPWLHMLASVRTPDGLSFTNSGMAVMFPPNTVGPVTFTAVLSQESLPITDPLRQLTVALVFIGANDHIYWATKLAG